MPGQVMGMQNMLCMMYKNMKTMENTMALFNKEKTLIYCVLLSSVWSSGHQFASAFFISFDKTYALMGVKTEQLQYFFVICQTCIWVASSIKMIDKCPSITCEGKVETFEISNTIRDIS